MNAIILLLTRSWPLNRIVLGGLLSFSAIYGSPALGAESRIVFGVFGVSSETVHPSQVSLHEKLLKARTELSLLELDLAKNHSASDRAQKEKKHTSLRKEVARLREEARYRPPTNRQDYRDPAKKERRLEDVHRYESQVEFARHLIPQYSDGMQVGQGDHVPGCASNFCQ